jgi:hypothetical protein
MTAVARWALVATLALASGVAASQTIYRCGHDYSRVPCPGARALEVEARTTAAQRAEARQFASREKRLADEMARDRRLAEAAQRPALATSLGPAPKVAAATPVAVKKPGKKKKHKATTPGDDRDFIAAVPRAKKAPNP